MRKKPRSGVLTDERLKAIGACGMNGVWLRVKLREVANTCITRRTEEGERDLAYLRDLVRRAGACGVKVWIFGNEPWPFGPDDPLLKEHPELGGQTFSWYERRMWCPSEPLTLKFMEEAIEDVFREVPGLGGFLNISNGEALSTCLDGWCATPMEDGKADLPNCPRCTKRHPWQLHEDVATAIVKGMRRANPSARYLSWFYHPIGDPLRKPWVADCARHVPEGCSFVYNFESGGLKAQGGRMKCASDYWLSFVGPAIPFKRVAYAARQAKTPLSAKIQVGCSHEVATVPYVPVPGLLYRKYRAMRLQGVKDVMMCWYFGNYPGVMNEAAGALAYEDFADGEADFLLRLAKPAWGEDAKTVADLWTRYSDAYSHYPLVNEMQYYGPFHAGIVWPLLPDVTMQNLGRTWKPEEPPSGDVIGEALNGFSLDDALSLATRMCEGVRSETAGEDTLAGLARRHAGARERLQDIGVMRTLGNLFESARDIFDFYRLRSEAIWRSRILHDNATAAKCVRRMLKVAANARAVTERQIPLCEADSRLGFHSEAEAHLFHPAYLRWRLARLDEAEARMRSILGELEAGRPYPESAFERKAERARVNGGWIAARAGGKDAAMRWRIDELENGDLEIRGENCRYDTLRLHYWDLCATHFQKCVEVKVGGGAFVARIRAADWGNDDRLKPRWFMVRAGVTSYSLWPGLTNYDHRLRLGSVQAKLCGRLVYDGE